MRRSRWLLLVSVAGCARGAPPPEADTTSGLAARSVFTEPSVAIDAGRGVINGISIGWPAESVQALLGAPLREGADPADTTGHTTLREYPMGTIQLTAGRGVTGFLCGGDDCRTADGVGIGDSTEAILQAYGPTPPRGPVEAPEALDYRLGDTPCNLTFTLSGGRVTSLALGCGPPS